MKTRAYDFVVQGKSPFPMDMLRYDRCLPVDGYSVEAIQDSLDVMRARELRSIKLRQYTASGMNGPTIDRWRSYGWSVNPDSIKKIG